MPHQMTPRQDCARLFAPRPARTPVALVLAICGLLLAALACPPAAVAHAQLVSSTPADGAALAAMPARVEFVFNEDVNPSFTQVVIASPDGRNLTAEQVTIDGPRVSAQVPAGLPGGAVTARYRVVSADGHPISGSISFTAGAGSTLPAATAATPLPATGTAAPGTAAQAASAPDPAGPGTGSLTGVYALTGAAAVLLVAAGILLLRTGRRPRG